VYLHLFCREFAEYGIESDIAKRAAPRGLKLTRAFASLKGMGSTYTIGKLAKEAGVPVSTVRYYERADLLQPDGRSEGNYRLYGPDSLGRLQFIRAAKAVGFTLEDIMELLHVQDGVTAPCDEVEELIKHRLEELGRRLSDLRKVRGTLKSLEKLCRETSDKDHCEVIDRLSTSETKG